MENQLDFGRIGGLATVALPLNFGVSMSYVTKKTFVWLIYRMGLISKYPLGEELMKLSCRTGLPW